MRPLPERPLSLARRLRFAVFPARCPRCGEVIPAQRLFCPACREELYRQASLRRFELPMADGTRLLPVAAVWKYDDIARRMIGKYKFHGKIDARDALGASMACLAEETLQGPFDLAVPAPSRPGRAKDLGFDHAGELARRTAQVLAIPCRRVLRRREDARVQHTLGRQERLVNLQGAVYSVEDLSGKRVLLVDDIVTTGATLCACARALYAAGAAQVQAVCAANSPGR